MLRECIWVESFRCANVLLLQRQGENFAHRHHLKFCYFQPVHCASKNPISPVVFNRFSKSLLLLEDVEGVHLGGNFRCASILFCTGTLKTLRINNIWNFATFNLYTVQAKILYLQWYSTDFRNLCFCSKMLRERIWWTVSYAQDFNFAMARWKLYASTTYEILPLSTCTLSQQKSYISNGIEPIFEIFASARRCWGWQFSWKVSYAHLFYFCSCKVKSLSIDNIWNFATFNLYTVPAKIQYLQRYSTDFRNLCLSSKILRECVWV